MLHVTNAERFHRTTRWCVRAGTLGLVWLAAGVVVPPLAARSPLTALVVPATAGGSAPTAAQTPAYAGRLDQVLDVYVRDGLVYYRALKSDRGALDRYIAGLDVPDATVAAWSRERQIAFWLNAYNAIVLRTVVDAYPIHGRSPEFPANSVRQIPGAFGRRTWRVGGRAMTLDDIEGVQLAAFRDPRLFFAIGRGALGSGRLRSETFVAERLEAQLVDVMADCVQRVVCANVDEAAGTLAVSPIFGWREALIATAPDGGVSARYAGRSPIELSILSLVEPHLFASERAWLAGNTFKVRYSDFDWRLNDLTGGPPR
jgi:hypothetical protein